MDCEEALKLLKESFGDNRIAKHSKAVCEKAVEIAEKIMENGHEVDVELVRVGALLHDIGRVKTHRLEHATEGGKMLREKGHEKLARIVETHISCNPAMSLEEKVVSYADKIIEEDRVVTLDERFENVIKRRKKHGQEEDIPVMMELCEKIKGMETEILHLMKEPAEII